MSIACAGDGKQRTIARHVGALTQTGCEQLRVEVGKEFLALCVELTHPCNDVSWRTHADDFHDSLEDEKSEVGKVWVRAVRLLLEGIHHTAIVAIVERLRGHGDKGIRIGSEVAQAQGLGTREERHPDVLGGGRRAIGRCNVDEDACAMVSVVLTHPAPCSCCRIVDRRH